MTHAETDAPDAPFPGARSQVRRPMAIGERRRGCALPLECRPLRSHPTWAVRLPVRAEQVTITKETFVFQEVTTGRKTLGERTHIEDTVRRETLRVDAHGAVEVPASPDDDDGR